MSKIGRAIAIAAEVHKDQVDKADEPYIYHVLAVAQRAKKFFHSLHSDFKNDDFFSQWEEEVVIVAILHDVVEDFVGSPSELQILKERIASEFGGRVYTAVIVLSKPKVVPYMDYIEGVSKNWRARIVKLADLSHNMEAWRIPSGEITERWDKYHRAFVYLYKESE